MTRTQVLPRDATAIVGMGQTKFSHHAGRTELQLASEAIIAACIDAQIDVAEVDGLVSYTIDPVEESELVRTVGLQEVGYSARVPYGGGGSIGVLMHAAAAVAGGVADTVVAYRAVRARSGTSRFGSAKISTTAGNAHSGTTAPQWCTPHGALTPASWIALNATRYMHQYGATNEDFGRAVVQLRAYAATNPDAWGYKRPMTLADHQESRWIAEPCIRMFDCCQETDGAVALIITSRQRATAMPQLAVGIGAVAGAGLFEQEIASDHYRPDLSVMDSSVVLGQRLFDDAGFRRDDVDVAMVYDAFSPILLMQLEALGFCGLGEARDFIRDGNLSPTGRLPCNTNGGLIGEGYIHGLNLIAEAVRQIRGTAANQLPVVDVALVSASRTGAILTQL